MRASSNRRWQLFARSAVLTVAVTAVSVVAVVPATGATDRSAATGPHASAAYEYQKFSVRVAGEICHRVGLHSINDHGAILGVTACGHDVAFVRGAGRHLQFRFGPQGQPHPTSISDRGAIVGQSSRRRLAAEQAWLRAPGGKLTALADPHADSLGTEAVGINVRGAVVGFYYAGRAENTRGFVYDSRTQKYRPLNLPTRVHATDVVALDIDDRGDIAGYYTVKGGADHGFVITHGTFHRVDAPGAPRGNGLGTWVTSIGGPNLYAGSVMRIGSASRAYQTGFVDQHGEFSTIAVPAHWGTDTFINGMNHAGRLVGHYYTRSGALRAFTAHT